MTIEDIRRPWTHVEDILIVFLSDGIDIVFVFSTNTREISDGSDKRMAYHGTQAGAASGIVDRGL